MIIIIFIISFFIIIIVIIVIIFFIFFFFFSFFFLKFLELDFIINSCSVIWSTLIALTSHYMKRTKALSQTIITKHKHFSVFVFIWHLHTLQLHVHLGFKQFRVYNWFFAKRTCNVVFCEFSVTFAVHRVTTSKRHWSFRRSLHIFHTNTTILFELTCYAWMIILHTYRQTTLTSITMKEVFFSTYSTNSTTITMKNFLPFIIVVPKFTDFTKISSKLNFAILTIFLWFLYCFTI